jgi:cardiolipin synthase
MRDRAITSLSNLPQYCPPAFGAVLRFLVLTGFFSLAACASLPEANQVQVEQVTSQPNRIKFDTVRGPVSPKKSNAILQDLKSETGNIDILQKHLAVEQSINPNNPLVLGNKLVLLQDGPATYKAMFAAIRSAEDNINLETYIFEDGEVGNEFASLLLEKQAQGIQVNLIYDGVGSLSTPKAFFDRLSAAGIQVLEFNPVNPLKGNKKEWLLNNRDHRKLLIVDGKTAFLGGINISESYSSGSIGRSSRKPGAKSGGWRDTHLQIQGPVVADFQKLFMNTWARQKGPALPDRKYFPKLAKKGEEIVRAIGSASDAPYSQIYLTLLSALEHAERTVHLTNAYFVPDPQLIKALTDAAQRGVDVQFILPGKSDSWAVLNAGRSHYAELLQAGVHIYERRDAVLHSKTASIDGVWSTIGSTNLDWRSFLHNDELNAVILGTDFAQQMDAMFAQDRAASNPIVYEVWKRRSLLSRFKEWLARLPEYWL